MPSSSGPRVPGTECLQVLPRDMPAASGGPATAAHQPLLQGGGDQLPEEGEGRRHEGRKGITPHHQKSPEMATRTGMGAEEYHRQAGQVCLSIP